jgi:hypothetical protein
MQRASDDANAFLDNGPETDPPGAEHEFCGVAIEGKIAKSDDCRATCTGKGLAGSYTLVCSGKPVRVGAVFLSGEEGFGDVQGTHAKNYGH